MTSHRTRSRDSRLGRFVSKATALLHPDTTVTETVHEDTVTIDMIRAASQIIRVRALQLDEWNVDNVEFHNKTALHALNAALKAREVNR